MKSRDQKISDVIGRICILSSAVQVILGIAFIFFSRSGWSDQQLRGTAITYIIFFLINAVIWAIMARFILNGTMREIIKVSIPAKLVIIMMLVGFSMLGDLECFTLYSYSAGAYQEEASPTDASATDADLDDDASETEQDAGQDGLPEED